TDAKKCEFTCKSGFKLENEQCVQQTIFVCGEGQIPTTGCQCPAGTPKYDGYCCKDNQNNLVYSPDVPCGQEGVGTEGRTLASFSHSKEGTKVNFLSTSIPVQGTVINYYEWDFGDESMPVKGQEYNKITHIYDFDGSEETFLVSLLVHDTKGGQDQWSMSIKITKSADDLPDTEKCNARGNDLEGCHSSLDGCFLGSECESCAVVSECDDFSSDESACTGDIPGCDRYACDWDNLCLPAQVSEQDCQYVCINLNAYPNYYFNGKKEYPQTCSSGTCWECPTEGCKFTNTTDGTTITYLDGECVDGFKEVTIKNSNLGQDQKIKQPCSLSPVISFFTLFNIILTLSILTVFYIFRKKF
ncbi:MAG: PKD domain-containing protein, partial [Nanoarchaeota archaeon]